MPRKLAGKRKTAKPARKQNTETKKRKTAAKKRKTAAKKRKTAAKKPKTAAKKRKTAAKKVSRPRRSNMGFEVLFRLFASDYHYKFVLDGKDIYQSLNTPVGWRWKLISTSVA